MKTAVAFLVAVLLATAPATANCLDKPFDLENPAHLLTMPDGAGPFPVVVISHGAGTGRISAGFRRWAELYKSWGFASLYIDSISPRECSPNWPEGDHLRARDLADALSALVTIPRIDPTRVVVQGHSSGVSMSIRAATGRTKVPVGMRIVGAINFYPAAYACTQTDLSHPKWNMPVLTLIGEKDDGAQRCWKLMDLAFIVIPGARHAFDNDTRASLDGQCRPQRNREIGNYELCLKFDDAARRIAVEHVARFVAGLK